jgi:hypothetical protein
LEGLRKASSSSPFKTPKKLKLGNVLGPEMIPFTSQPHGTALSNMEDRGIDDNDIAKRSKIERALQIIMANWNKLESNLQMIYMEFDTTGRAETRF